jgi:SlyX protein
MDKDKDRVTELETALAHQEMKVQELSDIVDRQWKDIERLNRRLDRLVERIDEVAAAASEDTDGKSVTDIAAANKPPHY